MDKTQTANKVGGQSLRERFRRATRRGTVPALILVSMIVNAAQGRSVSLLILGLAVTFLVLIHFDDSRSLECRIMTLEALVDARREDLEYYCKTLSPGSKELAWCMHDLALLLTRLGRTSESEPLYRKALTTWEAALGTESEEVAGCLHNLGSLYNDLNRYADAEPLFHRALAIRRKVLGEGHPETVISVGALATHYRRRGNEETAECYLREWQDLRDRVDRLRDAQSSSV